MAPDARGAKVVAAPRANFVTWQQGVAGKTQSPLTAVFVWQAGSHRPAAPPSRRSPAAGPGSAERSRRLKGLRQEAKLFRTKLREIICRF